MIPTGTGQYGISLLLFPNRQNGSLRPPTSHILDSIHSIQTFLALVGNRLQRRYLLQITIYVIAFLLTSALLVPLLAHWSIVDRSNRWILFALGALTLAASAAAAVILPGRRWATPSATARYVGEHVTQLRSDLLSSIELIDSKSTDRSSLPLKQALFATTAERLQPIRIRELVPYSTLARACWITIAVAILYLGTALSIPHVLSSGWSRVLASTPKLPFDGATISAMPLIGDMNVVIEFPSYTRIPNLHLPTSSGDFEVVPGSKITLSTHATGPIKQARILLSTTNDLHDDEKLDLAINGVSLHATFEARREQYYRFEIDDGNIRHVEERARHIGIRSDKAPQIEFYAPADKLDVAETKRIELAYSAQDDFGIKKLELVYQEIGQPEIRKTLELSNVDDSPKYTQGKYLWDLSTVSLRPGTEIEYHLEVTDNDNVLGPNISRSRSYRLILYSPRKRHENLVSRQEQIGEKMLNLLSARLVSEKPNLAGHDEIQQAANQLVVEFGSLLSALKRDELTHKPLLKTLQEMRKRLDKRIQHEKKLFAELSRHEKKRSESSFTKRVLASDLHAITELEADILLLSDWLHRQEVENLLGISDEITSSQNRLKKLFQEHKRAGSPALLKEIDRELRVLEKRLHDLETQSGGMPEDVLDRFVNDDALRQTDELDCISQVRSLLASGDIEAAQQQMVRCSQQLDKSASSLEKSLQSLKEDTFSDEQRLFNKTMENLDKLAHDQEGIASETKRIYQRYADALEKRKDQQTETPRVETLDTLHLLQQRLDEISQEILPETNHNELLLLPEKLHEIETMLESGEFADALGIARYVHRSLETIDDELRSSLDENWSRQAVVTEKKVRELIPLASRLVDELGLTTPSPAEIMSQEDRQQLENLRQAQRSIRKRSQRLQKKTNEHGDAMPGHSATEIRNGLEQAIKHMEHAEKQMRSGDPPSARQESRDAAQKLRQAQMEARGAARQKRNLGRTSWRDEPIRIPGAENHKTPEKFREEILNAMENDNAPNGFAEQVKRYYKAIIR